MTRGRRLRTDDRGALLVIGGLMMVALLAFSALAVDIANARQNHRQLQNAADAAALAAGQDLPDMADAIETVKDYADRNYDIAPSEWSGCQDPDHLAQIPDTANSNQCISFTADAGQVRVRLPEQSVDTYFGSAIGTDSLSFDADATAAAVVGRADRIIPAAVSGPMGTGLLCIEQAGANQPCANRERGQFGSLASPRLNAFHPSANVNQTTLAINYAMNLDHNIEEYEAYPAVCDGDVVTPCSTTNVGTNYTANHVNSSTGNEVPPVTEGYVTGFTASTDDQGHVIFCGRLQRPDFTANNLLDPRPENCSNPGQPTMDVLGHTVNGRHIYYWLTDAARQLFYPEAWDLSQKGAADTDSTFTLDNSALWAAGDARLDCFLAGYRYDHTTDIETLPDCTTVGLTLSGTGSDWSASVADNFDVVSYSNNDGTVAWSTPWVETGDDGTPSDGNQLILLPADADVPNGELQVNTSSTAMDDTISRTADLTNPSGGDLASTATLSFTATSLLEKESTVVLEVSPDGSTWTTLASFDGTTYGLKANLALPLPLATISDQTRVRFRPTVQGCGGCSIFVDNLQLDYAGKTTASSTIAPIFRDDFNTDPRWAVIPRVTSVETKGAKPIEGFWGFYGYTAYTTDTKVQAFDAWVFDPALMVNDPSVDVFFYGFSPEPVVRLVE